MARIFTPRRLHALHPQARLARRHFLGGAAVLFGLPWLESLVRPASAVTTAAPQRLLFWYVPNGMNMADFKVRGTGSSFTLSPILQPLVPYQGYLIIPEGLDNRNGEDLVAGDHARGTGCFLTCTLVNHSETDILNDISVDQVAAQAIGHLTPLPSLQLGYEGGSSVGDCDSGYSCAYVRNISWASPTTPLPQLTDPGLVLDLMFAGEDAGATDEERARRQHYRLSVLDTVLDEIHDLEPRLSTPDRLKLDEYLTGVRDLETRVAAGTDLTCERPDEPGSGLGHEASIRAMVDVMVTALQCDATRVISFMAANGGSGLAHDFLGINSSHHDISHHQSDPTNLAALTAIDTWEVSMFAYLLERLSTVEDAHGPLLDNTLALFGSEIADGDAHGHRDMPLVLAGGGGGLVSPGQHIQFSGRPLADLYLTMLQAVGVNQATFGSDGTAPIDLA